MSQRLYYEAVDRYEFGGGGGTLQRTCQIHGISQLSLTRSDCCEKGFYFNSSPISLLLQLPAPLDATRNVGSLEIRLNAKQSTLRDTPACAPQGQAAAASWSPRWDGWGWSALLWNRAITATPLFSAEDSVAIHHAFEQSRGTHFCCCCFLKYMFL